MSITHPPAASAPIVDAITISYWSDELIDRLGHDPRSSYVELFWLSVLGPSTVWLLRHCARLLDTHPDGARLDLADTARQLGVGHKGGRNSPLARSIQRACRFGAARPDGPDSFAVRRKLPPLNRGQIERLPIPLQRRHEQYLRRPDPGSDTTRARRLALGLVECGESIDRAEHQLDEWRFTPAVAAAAVNWAWELRHRAPKTGPEAA